MLGFFLFAVYFVHVQVIQKERTMLCNKVPKFNTFNTQIFLKITKHCNISPFLFVLGQKNQKQKSPRVRK